MYTGRQVCQTCLENADAELQFYKLDLLESDSDGSSLRDKLYSCIPEYEDVSTIYFHPKHSINTVH